jgi:predicted membrane-bound dolichyl-phosphate-mannose-protein mannosyltransferase
MNATRPVQGTHRSRTRLLCIAVIALAFAFKAPFAVARLRVTPDVVSYQNIAQNLADGRGFTSSLMLHYPSQTRVRHTALSDWPPVYPMFAAVAIRCGGSLAALQLVNALLASIAAGLVFLIGVRLFDRSTGLLAGAAAILAPNIFRAGCVAMSDALGVTLALVAVLLALAEKPRVATSLAAGVLAGAAALTRYPNAVVAVALVGYTMMQPKSRRHALACAAGFACLVTPFAVWQWLCRESTLGNVQALHYEVGSFHHAMWNASIVADPWYAAHNLGSVLATVLGNALFYAWDLFAGPRGLLLLTAGLIAWALCRPSESMTRQRKLVLTVAALSFAVYAVTWSIPPVKGSRFMLLTYCMLLPFCAAGLARAMTRRGRWLAVIGCVAMAGVYLWGCVTAASYTAGEITPLGATISRKIARSLPSGTSIASNNPWVVSYSTGAPTVLLPRDLDNTALARYVRHLNVGQIVLLGQHPRSTTADAVRACYGVKLIGRGVALALTGRGEAFAAEACMIERPDGECFAPTDTRDHGQKAYEGRLKMMPQMVQKLPTTHSPSITPRKNGSARR